MYDMVGGSKSVDLRLQEFGSWLIIDEMLEHCGDIYNS